LVKFGFAAAPSLCCKDWSRQIAEEDSKLNLKAPSGVSRSETPARKRTARNKPDGDELNILEHFLRNPSAKPEKVRASLGLRAKDYDNDIQYMTNRAEPWLEQIYKVAPRAVGLPLCFRVDIWVAPRELRNKLERKPKLKEDGTEEKDEKGSVKTTLQHCGGEIGDLKDRQSWQDEEASNDFCDPVFPVITQSRLARYILKYLSQREEFKKIIFVEDVKILMGGPADLSATVQAASNESIFTFVTHGLRLCTAISNTTTYLVQESYGWPVEIQTGGSDQDPI
jgi:hypothetical protein